MLRYCTLLGLSLLASSSYATKYQLSTPQVTLSAAEQKATHPMTAIGQAVFRNGVKIPAISVSVPTGVDEDDSPHSPSQNCQISQCFFDMKLDPQLASQFKAYHIADTDEWILAPATFTRFQGAIGVNGNTAIVMSSPDRKSNLSLYVVPACVGCALDAASIYFPQAARENKATFGTEYSGSNVPLKLVRPNKETVYFQYQLPQQYSTDGVAKFSDEADIYFQELNVTLAPHQKALASAMLNFFSLTHSH
ncbi:uncharacterized protein DUF4850 [Acinetobacter calcoaceticus]|uniref:Uncharacterized protein DUF4850 n=1 Tax=Acinetobacter calcoaceticus TaxID=471 RepID=A0A4R1XWX4_ACICA|nr:uncharacterized protein DUF4850 [Acinetobacter calcoaceticus]